MQAVTRSALPGHPAAQPRGRLVYIVDDDEAVRDSLRWLLEGNGFERPGPSRAPRLPAGLRSGTRFACLVLDVRMNGMSGIELHDELLRRGERTCR